jgi:hypothetical protein
MAVPDIADIVQRYKEIVGFAVVVATLRMFKTI